MPRSALRPGGRTRGHKLAAEHATWSIGFVAVMFWVFVEYMRLQDKYAAFANVPLGDISLVLLVVGLIANREHLRLGGAVGGWTVVLLLWGLVASTLADASMFLSHRYYDTLKTVLVFFVLVSIITTPKRLHYFVYMLMFVYFAHTNFSIREWALNGFVGLPAGQYVGAGFLSNPNDFGAALSAAWGISLFLALHDKGTFLGRWPMRWLHVVNTVCFVIAVVTSSSRGTALGFACGCIYLWLVFVKGFKAKLLWVLPIALGFLGVMLAMTEDQLARFETMGEDASSQDRLRTWRVAWQVFLDNPIFGIGIGNFPMHTQSFTGQGQIFVQHNILLQALTDMGVLGLLIVLALFASAGLSLHRALRYRRETFASAGDTTTTQAILLGLGVCLVSLFANGQTITVLYYPFVWVLLALTAAASRIENDAHAGERDAPIGAGGRGPRVRRTYPRPPAKGTARTNAAPGIAKADIRARVRTRDT